MTLGILEGGPPPPAVTTQFGGYADMVRRLLGPQTLCEVHDAREALPAPDACTAWLVTGSPAAAYDDTPWIARLEAFLQAASGRAPIVGICFGHQLMAQAYGGRVIKSPKGRAVGLHTYEITQAAAWMDSPAPVSLPVAHEDQVVEIGEGCVVLGGNAFTPNGVLAYPERRALSFQSHPEFPPDFARAVVEAHRQEIGDSRADAAVRSLSAPNDSSRVAGWLTAFLAG